MIVERAPAKVNLVLHVGPRREDGLHELASLFAAIDLVDDVAVEVARANRGEDRVTCPGVSGPNICERALRSFRSRTGGELAPLEVADREAHTGRGGPRRAEAPTRPRCCGPPTG